MNGGYQNWHNQPPPEQSWHNQPRRDVHGRGMLSEDVLLSVTSRHPAVLA